MFGKKDKPTTLEEVRKAYENLSEDDKKTFHQSIADRIHESIGEQEEEHGQKDSQSAADREHEALGAEHAAGEGDTSELGETDKETHEEDESEAAEEAEHAENSDETAAEETTEQEADNYADVIQTLATRVNALEESLKEFSELKSKMEEYTNKEKERFGYKGQLFGDKKNMGDMSAAELKKAILTGQD